MNALPVALISAAVVILGSIAAMVGIIRRSRFVPLVAMLTGTAGVLFFSTVPVLQIPGLVVSLLAIALAPAYLGVRYRTAGKNRARRTKPGRNLFVLSASGKWRRVEEYFSESGKWRARTS